MRVIAHCLVTTSLVALAALAATPTRAANLEASSSIDTVTVYPDGASVTRVIAVDLPAGDNTVVVSDFPLGLDRASLRVEGEADAKLAIGAIDAKTPRAESPVDPHDIDKRIQALKDQRQDLQGAIDAANARRKFAEHFAEAAPAGIGDKGEARPISEWREAFAAVSDEVAAAEAAVRDAERKQRDLDREIAKLASDRQVKPPNKLEVRLDLAAAGATTAKLRVTYNVRNARWTPLYDARLDTGARDRKPALELVRRAEITQSTGEDWSDVALSVSTVRTAQGGNAPELNSLIVRYPEPPQVSSAPLPAAPLQSLQRSADRRDAALAAPMPMKKAEEQEAVADTGGYQVMFRIQGRVSLSASEGAKSLRISTASIVPDLIVRAVPVLDPTAYLEASFHQSEDAPLLPGRIAIYRDGAFVGREQMKAASKDEIVRLGFGADDKVKVERTVVKRNEGSAGLLVATSKTDERSFKTSVRNGHDFPIKVAIDDQLPVSETEDIQVDLLPASTPPTTTNLRDKRGVLEWAFEAKPGESRDIALAWRVRWPKDKGVVMLPSG